MTTTLHPSYLAGALDARAIIEIKKARRSIKIRIHVRSRNRKQILAIQHAFGGEIHRWNEDTYVIRYQTTVFRQLAAIAFPFLSRQRARFEKALAAVKTKPSNQTVPIDETFYQLGAQETVSQDVPFDKTILSCKNAAYYERKRRAEREKATAERNAKKALAEQAKVNRELVRQKAREDGIRRLAAHNQKQRDRKVARLQKEGEELLWKTEYDLFRVLEEEHNLWWNVAYRSKRPCRLCGQELPHSAFDKAVNSMDGLKYECKKCAYERYVKPHMAERRARTKKWQKANPEKAKAARRKQLSKPHIKIRKRLVKRLKQLIGSKSERYHELIGCTPKELVAHLQSLFKPGMSWENSHEWHIDHKIPCRAFDLSQKEERLKCFHYSNLQPLWAAENSAKSDQMPDGTNARDFIPAPAP